jgi:(E)-4-hydroxy-3-methylbut-2-enyl-diphosphate synthase
MHKRFEYSRRKTHTVGNIGGDQVPVVIATADGGFETVPDYILSDGKVLGTAGESYSIYSAESIDALLQDTAEIKFLKLQYTDLNPKLLGILIEKRDIVVLLSSAHLNGVGEMRAFFHTLLNAGATVPVILCRHYNENELQYLQIKSAADLGVQLIDGFGDGIMLENTGSISIEAINSVAFGILQASRVRVTKTEFISCPGCGRTMFKLQTVIARVKARTSHLKGLKIGIMGCVVNGPGEMADADYGYVGAGRGKVSLYKKKECLERSIAEDEAVEKLIDIIKINGDWHE